VAGQRLSRHNRKLIEQSGLFDARWYLEHTPEAASSRLDPLTHYFCFGSKSDRSPGPFFDSAWYRTLYNDVEVGGWEPLLHYVRYGMREGRRLSPAGGSAYDAFQSLGEDCEFGCVQRSFNSNLLGLFVFAGTDMDGLIGAFDYGLDRFISEETLEITRLDDEYCTRITPFNFKFHTHVLARNATIDQIKNHETRRLQFLAQKTIEDLSGGRKIFVYKGNQASIAKAEQLCDRLQRYGPNRLLCVTLTQDAEKLATLEALSDNLVLAYIDRFAVEPEYSSRELWSAICMKALTHWDVRVAGAT
jgi:hypothetical protein